MQAAPQQFAARQSAAHVPPRLSQIATGKAQRFG
jgi:hypothetical protein